MRRKESRRRLPETVRDPKQLSQEFLNWFDVEKLAEVR